MRWLDYLSNQPSSCCGYVFLVLKGKVVATPFLLRIFCLFCRYVAVLKDYYLLRYLFKYDFNSFGEFIIIFILSILFLFRSTLTVRLRNLR